MAHKIAPTAQEAIATARFIRMSPTKARQLVNLIRGRHVDDARRVLKFTPRAAAEPVGKVLESAIANAEHNRALPADELIVVRTWVDEGPTLRRFRPRAMGRATRIRKRTCHISVVVGRPEEKLPVVKQGPGTKTDSKKKTTRKKTTAKKTTKASTEPKATETSTESKRSSKKTTAKKTTAKKTTARKKTTRRKKDEGES